MKIQKKTTKPMLNGYSTSKKIFAGTIVTVTVIVAGYFGYRYYQQKTTPVQSVKPTTQSQTNKTIQTASLNGKYTGTSTVAQGLSEVTVNISGSSLAGDAVYVAPNNVRISGLKITGTVKDLSKSSQARGNIEGKFSGSGTVLGQKVNVNGTFSGHIINTSMNVSYSAVTNYGTFPGQITLSKK